MADLIPSSLLAAEKLDCVPRCEALLQAFPDVQPEFASLMLSYLEEEDEEVVTAACAWMASAKVEKSLFRLAQLAASGRPRVHEAAARALESIGASWKEVSSGTPLSPEQKALLHSYGFEEIVGTMLLVQRKAEEKWELAGGTVEPSSPPSNPFPEQVRNRPGLYFGSTHHLGAHQLAIELIGNAVDQFLAGHASVIHVRHDERTMEVEDDGQGYPLDSDLGERYLTHLHNSPTGDDHAPHVHLVTQGVGLAPVNAVCSEYQVESVRQGQQFRLLYRRGQFVTKEKVESDLAKGTRIKLTLDSGIWHSGFEPGPLRRRLFEFVHLIPGLTITLNHERFHAPRGLLDLAEFVNEGFGADSLIDGRKMGIQAESDFLILQFAATGETEETTQIESWVNGARTEEHGSHVDGALEALEEVGWRPARLLVHVIMRDPRYAGPVRRQLQVPKALRQVRALLRRKLSEGIGPQ